MSTAVREPRTAVMIRVEVSWEDSVGNLRTATARMEDKSLSGACIRVKKPIEVGVRLRIQWRFEQFSGVVKYCRREDWDYVAGIQRDAENLLLSPSVDNDGMLPESAKKVQAPAAAVLSDTPSVLQTDVRVTVQKQAPSNIPATNPKVESEAVLSVANVDAGAPMRGIKRVEVDYDSDRARARNRSTEGFGTRPRNGVRRAQKAETREISEERKSMVRKWLGLAPWQSKRADLSATSAGESADGDGKSEKEKSMHNAFPSSNKNVEESKPASDAGFQVDLLPVEDIYRAAGIMNPRRGYSVRKVVEMLESEHLVGLEKDMRRAAVLMALEAAGVSLGQVQQDAKERQDALDCYEADQTELVKAEWTRKAEENIRIEEELERVKTQYAARVNRNLEAVAREKVMFDRWLMAKQQEVQSISAAVDLCLKRDVPGPVSVPPLAGAAAAGSGTGPVLSAPKPKV
jgi:hypothetical protein